MRNFILPVILFTALIVCALTCPDREQHVEAMTTVMENVANDKIAETVGAADKNNPLAKGLATIGSAVVSKTITGFLDTKLKVNGYLLVSIGQISYNGEDRIVSVGVLNHVFTCSEQDVKKAVDKML